ncbi:MAG: HAMP domain-containing histidine kinase [Deltaproteobacteria bacterium]|nr:HAMP domain-containing histidine kinase [Deltaproteobacteria bacterium]
MSYRNRVVAYTVAVVLAVAGAFFAIHRSMTGRLFRTGVDEPWHELADALASDPFVQARLLGRPGAGSSEGAAPIVRSLEPDERILGYVVVDPARVERGRRPPQGPLPNSAVIDRMGRAGPESTRLVRELDQAIDDSLAAVPDPESPETRRRGDVTVRVGAVALARPVPPPELAQAGALAASVRRTLDTLSSRVLARFGAGHEGAEGPIAPGEREALEALVSLNGALTNLESRVLVPASLGSAAPGAVVTGPGGEEIATPDALAEAARLIDELAQIPGALGDRVDPAAVRHITARIGRWIEDTDFQPGPTALVAAAFASPHLALFQQLARRYLWVSAFLVAAGVALGVVVARRSTEPLSRIQEGIERFARGDFAHRIDVGSADVLASVARDLNQMAERIAEGERARRLASMGLLVGGAAHELKNPVHALDQALGLVAKYHAELATPEPAAASEGERAGHRRQELTERITRLLAGGVENVERMRAILDEISAVQRVATDRREPRDLVADTKAAIDALAARWKGSIELSLEAPPELIVEATASLARIPQNLVSNAIAAVDEGRASGRGSRRVAVRLAREGEQVVLTVDDDGAGVNPTVRERIFDLFFTTREVGRGTGLGLFLVHEIVAAHGGHVRCVSPGPLGGARFEVRVPIAAAGAELAT